MRTLCCGQASTPPDVSGEGESTESERLWLSGQANIVNQSHPGFRSEYSGPASLNQNVEQETTWVGTIYTAFGLSKNTEFFFDVESAHGAGVSGALGLGGLPNLDATTDPCGNAAPYVACAQVRQEIIPLGGEMEEATRSPLTLATSVPSKRLEIRVGKMSVTDFFDLNSVANDSHLQFLNYAIDNDAAYDYAANSRGYTYGVLFELYHPKWVARFGEMFQPQDNTGLRTNWTLPESHSENYEIELHRSLVHGQPGVLRLMAFTNVAVMGSYSDALSAYLSGEDPTPDLEAHIKPGQFNYGFGLNGEQEIKGSFRLFGRLGWKEGSNEEFQFAEADQTAAFGGDLGGKKWRRPEDRIGIAGAINGLSGAHRTYLELGGTSFLLGDDGLNYSREKILEGYYNYRLRPGLFLAFDLQHIQNPGYNSARGPVWIFGLRLHLEGEVHFK